MSTMSEAENHSFGYYSFNLSQNPWHLISENGTQTGVGFLN